MARPKPKQLELPAAKTWGGRRPGAGRKPGPGRPLMARDRRPDHDRRHPVQVTLRAARGTPSLRSATVFPALRRAIARASHARFRVLHFSAQQDHVHLIVEGDGPAALRAGIQGLAIRIALAVNRVTGRRGKLWGDRYHARALATPRQVRASMIYVLLNFRKHLRAAPGIDPCSSGPHFAGWHGRPPPPRAIALPAPVVLPATWLARLGWLRAGGALRVDEGPA